MGLTPGSPCTCKDPAASAMPGPEDPSDTSGIRVEIVPAEGQRLMWGPGLWGEWVKPHEKTQGGAVWDQPF